MEFVRAVGSLLAGVDLLLGVERETEARLSVRLAPSSLTRLPVGQGEGNKNGQGEGDLKFSSFLLCSVLVLAGLRRSIWRRVGICRRWLCKIPLWRSCDRCVLVLSKGAYIILSLLDNKIVLHLLRCNETEC